VSRPGIQPVLDRSGIPHPVRGENVGNLLAAFVDRRAGLSDEEHRLFIATLDTVTRGAGRGPHRIYASEAWAFFLRLLDVLDVVASAFPAPASRLKTASIRPAVRRARPGPDHRGGACRRRAKLALHRSCRGGFGHDCEVLKNRERTEATSSPFGVESWPASQIRAGEGPTTGARPQGPPHRRESRLRSPRTQRYPQNRGEPRGCLSLAGSWVFVEGPPKRAAEFNRPAVAPSHRLLRECQRDLVLSASQNKPTKAVKKG
jgi:hypothetical protein